MGFFFVITEVQWSHQFAVCLIKWKLAIDFEKLSLKNHENFRNSLSVSVFLIHNKIQPTPA